MYEQAVGLSQPRGLVEFSRWCQPPEPDKLRRLAPAGAEDPAPHAWAHPCSILVPVVDTTGYFRTNPPGLKVRQPAETIANQYIQDLATVTDRRYSIQKTK